jgi:hypothetical protein
MGYLLMAAPQGAQSGNGIGILGIIIGAIILFFILREVNCWYWKINERVALLKGINSKLDAMAGSCGSGPSGIAPREQTTCKHCGKKTDTSSKYCESCGQAMT